MHAPKLSLPVGTTRQSIYQQYTTVEYKGTGIATVNLICMLSNAELNALLTYEKFDETTELPEPRPTNELYILLRSQLKDRKVWHTKEEVGGI